MTHRTGEPPSTSNRRDYTFRLRPKPDPFELIEAFVKEHSIQAGCILSGIESLTLARLRFANHEFYSDFEGHFEILSITGTVSIHGSHLHISISDGEGRTLGGHLESGCKIYTAEMVLAVFDDVVYKRELAEDSWYEELVVYPM